MVTVTGEGDYYGERALPEGDYYGGGMREGGYFYGGGGLWRTQPYAVSRPPAAYARAKLRPV